MQNTQYDAGGTPPRTDTAQLAARGFTLAEPTMMRHTNSLLVGASWPLPNLAPYGLRPFSAKDPDGYTILFQESRHIARLFGQWADAIERVTQMKLR